MTLVTAPVAIPIRRILRVPLVARIVAGSSRAAVNLDPNIATIVISPQRPAAAALHKVMPKPERDQRYHQDRCRDLEFIGVKLPAVGPVPADQPDSPASGGRNV